MSFISISVSIVLALWGEMAEEIRLVGPVPPLISLLLALLAETGWLRFSVLTHYTTKTSQLIGAGLTELLRWFLHFALRFWGDCGRVSCDVDIRFS